MKTKLKVLAVSAILASMVLPQSLVNAASLTTNSVKLHTKYKILINDEEYKIPTSITFDNGRDVPLATYKNNIVAPYAGKYLTYNKDTSVVKFDSYVVPEIEGTFRSIIDEYGRATEDNLDALYNNHVINTVMPRKVSKISEYRQQYDRENAKETPDRDIMAIAQAFINCYTEDVENIKKMSLVELQTGKAKAYGCLPYLYTVSNLAPSAINSNGQVVETSSLDYYLFEIIQRDLRYYSLNYTIDGKTYPVPNFDKNTFEYTVTLPPNSNLRGISLSGESYIGALAKEYSINTMNLGVMFVTGQPMVPIGSNEATYTTGYSYDCSDVDDIDGYTSFETIYKVKFVVSPFPKGDMNLDGKVNSTDAAIVLDKYNTNNITQTDLNRGDMNLDGKLNSSDASMILSVF